MNYDLNDTKNLTLFLNQILDNEENNYKAPNIIKFFILTRNYGLTNAIDYINRIYNNENLLDIAIDAIKNGFMKDNIEFNNTNLINIVYKNFHENGFYFHSFPGIYKDSIDKNGLLTNKRNKLDEIFYQIIRKYQFGEYFEKSKNRICVTEIINNFSVYEYSIFTPEWLELFLKLGNVDIHDAFERGNLEEIEDISNISLNNIKEYMKKNINYSDQDYIFLKQYIDDAIYNRFKNGNNQIGICLIPKKDTKEYFGESLSFDNIEKLERIFNEQNYDKKEIINFFTNNILIGEKTTIENIPRELFEIVTYNIKTKNLEEKKSIS